MMYITLADQAIELKTTLGVAKKLEARFKLPLPQLFDKLGAADIGELIAILAVSADKTADKEFEPLLLDNWDYTDLYSAVQELVAHLMYSGTPEQVEAKLAKSPMPEDQKNALRELLGIPLPPAPGTTGNEL